MKAFLTGLGAGVALGILFAPRSGEETRGQLRERADEWSDMAREQIDRAQQYAGDLQESARDLGRRVSDAAQSASSQVRDAAEGIATRAGGRALLKVNTASRDELMQVNGIGPVLADRIIESRPFLSVQQLMDRGILPESTYQELLREFRAA